MNVWVPDSSGGTLTKLSGSVFQAPPFAFARMAPVMSTVVSEPAAAMTSERPLAGATAEAVPVRVRQAHAAIAVAPRNRVVRARILFALFL